MPYTGIKPSGRVPRLNRSHPHARGMVAYYLFEAGGGNTVTDLVTGLKGTLTNGPTWAGAPASGYGLTFASASTQYVDLGQPSLLDFNATNAMAVAASYKLTTVPNFTNAIIASKGSQWVLDLDGPSTGARFYTNNGSGGGLWSESRALSASESRVVGGSVSITDPAGYLMVDGIPIGFSNPPFVSLPSAAVETRIGSGASGAGPLNGTVHWIALWNRYLAPGVMADFHRNPFACLRPGPPVFSFAPAASGGTTISTTSAISLGASATVVQGISVSASSAVSLGSAASITLTSPSISFSTTTALSLGSSATVTQGMSFAASSGLSLGASAAATFTTATTISTTSVISLGAASTVTFASSALSISTTSAIALGAAATVTFVGPPTTISTTSALSLGAASTVTLTSPALSISTTSALSLGSSAAVTFTSTGIAFTVASSISLGSSAAVTLTTATTIATTSAISLGAASTVTFTSAYATLLEAVAATLKAQLVSGTANAVYSDRLPPVDATGAKISAPYIVVAQIGDSREWTTTGGDYIDSGMIQVAVYAPGKKVARTVADAAALVLNDASLTFDEGRLMLLRQESRVSEADADRDPSGRPLWAETRTYQYKLSSGL